MAMSEHLVTAMLALGSIALSLLAWAWAARRRRARAASGKPAGPDPLARRLEQRMETIESRLAEIAAGASEERLQAMAGSLLALVRDKNAAMETALAGLDQLRARMRALEQMGNAAEARGLFEGVVARLDTLQAAQSAGDAALQARLSALEGLDAGAALAGQFARLIEHKDAAVAAVLQRLGPLEARIEELRGVKAAPSLEPLVARLSALEAGAGAPGAAIDAVAARIDAVLAAHAVRLVALEAPADNPFEGISERLSQLYAQKDAAVETVFARLAPLEARLGAIEAGVAAQDPRAALDRFSERLEAVQGRLAALEVPGENPFAEISGQLTRLYAQKDATLEAVIARLAPLEARLTGVEAVIEGRDPRAALDRFSERLEAVQSRLAVLEVPGENPFAEISGQLTRLYAQKDATVETVFARLAPMEARLAGLEAGDPRAMLDRFAERLEAMQSRIDAPGENPFSEISEQLTRLYAQKDATVETVFARLAPLEARLAGLEAGDPRAMLDRFAERLDVVQGRLAVLEAPGENPFAEISEQLTRLYAQKDATVETVFARLAPLEARLAGLEAGDPRAVLDRFAERLDAVQGRLAVLEAPGENPFAEISEQLTRLYSQKDATVETVFARLAPLEARLTAVEAGNPRAMLDRFAERLEAMQSRIDAPGESPFAEISEQLTRLYAQKDATVETVFARLAPMEARLAGLEAGDPRAALDLFAERLEAVQGRLAVLETPGENPFADISEQLVRLYAQKDATVETVFARLAPLEARLGAIEAGAAGSLPRLAALEAADPRAALAEIAGRVAALQEAQAAASARLAALQEAAGDTQPFAEIADQLARMHARGDAAAEAVAGRIAPLEARIVELEARRDETGAEAARAEAEEIAAQMIALRAAAAQTELFADRLALLEASLPRLSAAQALMLQALERQGVPIPRRESSTEPSAEPAEHPGPAPEAEPFARTAPARAAADAVAGAFPDLPRVVSLHHP